MGSLWKFVACLRFTDLNFILKSVKRSPRECKRNRSGIKRNLCQKGDYVIYGAIRRRRSKSWSQIENFTRERSFIESFAIFDTANYSEAVIKTVKALNKCFARAFASQNSFRGVCYACDGGMKPKISSRNANSEIHVVNTPHYRRPAIFMFSPVFIYLCDNYW